MGIHRDPQLLVETLRAMRRQVGTQGCMGLEVQSGVCPSSIVPGPGCLVLGMLPHLLTTFARPSLLPTCRLTNHPHPHPLPSQVDISTEVGVVHDIRLQELRLYTDYGRCCRPLFIVEEQSIKVGVFKQRWGSGGSGCGGHDVLCRHCVPCSAQRMRWSAGWPILLVPLAPSTARLTPALLFFARERR